MGWPGNLTEYDAHYQSHRYLPAELYALRAGRPGVAPPKHAAASAAAAAPNTTARNANTNPSSMIVRTDWRADAGIDDTCPTSAPAILRNSRSTASRTGVERCRRSSRGATRESNVRVS